jgi:glycerophosphoryl diester phosphodiesterase
MWRQARDVVAGALRDFSRSWRVLAWTDLTYKAVAFALLTPATALFLRWLLSRTGADAVADADIARFFVATRAGVIALVLGGALIGAITAVEMACLMAVGHAAARGSRLYATGALAFGAQRAQAVLRLVANMIVRVLLGLLPFLAAGFLVYWTLLRPHDINYYLATKPTAFWLAAALAAVIGGLLVALLARTVLRWALALPIVLFERVLPARALGASAKRSAGMRAVVAVVLAAWAIASIALGYGSTALVEAVGRAGVPMVAGSVALLLLFVACLVLVWLVLGLAISVVQSSLFALVIVRLYLASGPAGDALVPGAAADGGRMAPRRRLTPRERAALACVLVLAVTGFALLAFLVTRGQREVSVIAHRGASLEAPENTLAAFRLAIEQGTDFVELDVQESSDGEVVVVHDSDLMKLGGGPRKIWETTAAELRATDIGSRVNPRFAGEGVPTLAEALSVAKGRARVIVELKFYGHNRSLEEKVAALVEAAGMEKDCVFMSLDHDMVAKMKRLRPEWRVGVLAAKALGDATSLPGDFLAVEARMVNARFVRRAHRAGKDVYVWTVDDPAWMLRAMSFGVDGLITNKPALAREVVAKRAAMSDAQRFLVAVLIRLGARTQALESEDALRP